MNLTNQILAPKENFVGFIKNYPSQTPLVMVNILKFKDQTEDGRTGEEEYSLFQSLNAQKKVFSKPMLYFFVLIHKIRF